MLFLSTLIESTVTGFLICLPMLVTDLAIMFPIPYGSHIAYIMFTAMSFQTLVSSILQAYFIKPFKKAALELIFVKVIRNLICKKGSSSSPKLFVQRSINSRIGIVATKYQ
uniref:Uncharacterized protein n=1 Tax=Acrobeloides nanus TaxID=290746 RepID=A0A914D1U3_9BILA